MAATEAKWGQGTILARDTTTIAQVDTIGDLELTQAAIPATNLQSADDFEEFIGGILGVGDLAITGHLKPGDTSGQIGLHTDLLAHTLQSFVMTFPTALATTWTFSALVTSFKTAGVSKDGLVGFAATLKPSGKPVLGITASNNITVLTIGDTTLYPAFAAATYDYAGEAVAATVEFTATFAAGTCKLYKAGVEVETLTTTVASSEQAMGAIGSMVVFMLKVTQTGKVTVTYTIRIMRSA